MSERIEYRASALAGRRCTFEDREMTTSGYKSVRSVGEIIDEVYSHVLGCTIGYTVKVNPDIPFVGDIERFVPVGDIEVE